MSFTYEGTHTLRNKFNIEDYNEFDKKSAQVTFARLVELELGFGPKPTFDQNYLQEIHRHLFQDCFEWAGHFRHKPFTFEDGTVASMPSMAKIGGKGFAYGDEIDRGLNDFMSTLKKSNYFKDLDRSAFTDKAADAFSYLNEIHPFREGNGRTQRAFFTALAHNAGHNLDFSVISAERMRFASVEAHEKNNLEPFKRMFLEISDPLRVKALTSAQNFLTKSYNNENRNWQDLYISTTEAGRRYEGQFVGNDRNGFLMRIDNGLVVGQLNDMPEPAPSPGSSFSFTASEFREVSRPLIPRRETQSLDNTAFVTAVIKFSDVHQARLDLKQLCEDTFREPDKVLGPISQSFKEGQIDRSIAARAVQSPDDFGGLRGNIGMFGKADKERQQALENLKAFVPSAEKLADVIEFRSRSVLEQHERQVRRDQILIPSPSDALRTALMAGAVVAIASDENLRKEVQSICHALEERFSASEIRALNQGDLDPVRNVPLQLQGEELQAILQPLSEANKLIDRQERQEYILQSSQEQILIR